MGNLSHSLTCLVALTLFLIPALSAVIRTSDPDSRLLPPTNSLVRSTSGAISKRHILDEYIQHYTGHGVILPIQDASRYLDETLDMISTKALLYYLQQKPELPSATLKKSNLALTFTSSHANIPVPWEFVIHFCEYLAIEAVRGWTGIYEGSWIHVNSLVAISVRMTVTLVAAAA